MLILLGVLLLDFSNPLLPGSVRFNPPSLEVAREPAPLVLPHPVRIAPSGPTPTTRVERRRFLAVRLVRHQPEKLTPALPTEDL